MDFGRAFDSLALLFLAALLLAPLGIWKLIEIIIWLWKHIDVSIK